MLHKYSILSFNIKFNLIFQCLKHPYFKVGQDLSNSHIPRGQDSSASSAKSRDSKQIFTDDWETDNVKKDRSSPDDMNDLDALLKEFEQPKKSTVKENQNKWKVSCY